MSKVSKPTIRHSITKADCGHRCDVNQPVGLPGLRIVGEAHRLSSLELCATCCRYRPTQRRTDRRVMLAKTSLPWLKYRSPLVVKAVAHVQQNKTN